MSNVVQLSIEYFPDSTTGKPVANGSIYVGVVDTDPKIAGNQKQISVLQENGTTVAVTQPLSTSAGGVPLYNSSPVTILVDGSYSLRVDNSAGAQVYYVPKNAELEALNSFDSIADMRAITDTPTDGDTFTLLGYYTPGDGGGGQFFWDSTSTETDNGGTIIKVTAITTGRWKRIYSTPISVKMFGSVNDGVENDAPYIINALEAVTTYGVLNFGRYYYKIDSAIAVDVPGYNFINAEGAFFETTLDGKIFDFNPSDTAQQPGFRWAGGVFESTSATKTASNALYFEEWRNVVVEDARFTNYHTAIKAVDRDTFTFKNNHFFNNTYHVSYDNTGSGGSWGNLIIKAIDNHFSLTDCTAGIFIDGITGAIQIDGNSFNGAAASGIDIYVKNTGHASGPRGLTISNNHFEQGVSGQKYVYIEDTATGGPYRGVSISGNAFNDDGPVAVDLESVWGCSITGNSFSQSTSVPVNIDANCLDINLSGNGFSTGSIVFACDRGEISFAPYLVKLDHRVVTGYDGVSVSTGSATIDMSSAISAVFPSEIVPKGYDFIIQAQDSGSAAGPTVRVDLSKDNTIASQNRLMVKVGDASNDNLVGTSGFVPCDSNGDVFINYIASGAGTLDIYLAVTAIHI